MLRSARRRSGGVCGRAVTRHWRCSARRRPPQRGRGQGGEDGGHGATRTRGGSRKGSGRLPRASGPASPARRATGGLQPSPPLRALRWADLSPRRPTATWPWSSARRRHGRGPAAARLRGDEGARRRPGGADRGASGVHPAERRCGRRPPRPPDAPDHREPGAGRPRRAALAADGGGCASRRRPGPPASRRGWNRSLGTGGAGVGAHAPGASTTDVMLAWNWKTSRMVAHYSATAERGAVARYGEGIRMLAASVGAVNPALFAARGPACIEEGAVGGSAPVRFPPDRRPSQRLAGPVGRSYGLGLRRRQTCSRPRCVESDQADIDGVLVRSVRRLSWLP